MKRRAKVEETSLAIQFVTIVILRRYLLSRSESKINFSGFDPLRLMTTMPCWPSIASSCRELEKMINLKAKNETFLHLPFAKRLVLQMILTNQHHTAT